MNGQILRMNKQHEQNLFMLNNEWINLFILLKKIWKIGSWIREQLLAYSLKKNNE